MGLTASFLLIGVLIFLNAQWRYEDAVYAAEAEDY